MPTVFASFADPTLQLGETPADTFQIAMKATFDYIYALVEQRRADPRDDLCSMAAVAEVGGEPMTQADAAWNCWALLAAGFETSRNIISGGLHMLIEHPDQAARLRAEPKLLQTAVDEMIRWTTPATATLRVATQDTEIASQPIRAGEWLVLYAQSANRDDAVFAEPFRFDISRRPNPYLSFGHGVHNCIGRMLAIQECKVMIGRLLRRSRRIDVAGPFEWSSSTIAKGIKNMPIRVEWER